MPFKSEQSEKQNRRIEPRFNIDGEVVFSFDDPVHREIHAELLDYSQGGFRAVHRYPALTTGQVVRYQRLVACGQAQVVWNRILGEKVETGFVTL